ncbi:MAG: glycosyltransferase family 2 protein [bacterium]|nr:glycosyltransferase family 2 protein [bacterium]
MTDVSVLIPVWDEEQAIGRVVRGALAACAAAALGAECVVCVDARTADRSAEAAAEAGARTLLQQGRGLTGAVLEAAAAAAGPIAVVLDGDGQHDPADAGRLLGPLLEGRADLVCGARSPASLRSGFGGALGGLWRRVGSAAFAGLARAATGVAAPDPLTGMFACRTADLRALGADPAGCPPGGYKLLVALLAATPPDRVAHAAVTFHPRTGGASHMNLRTSLTLARQLAHLARRRARGGGRLRRRAR